MAKKVLTNLDMNKNQILNAIMQPLAVAPSSPVLGQYYYNSADKKMYQWNGSAWESNGIVYTLELGTISATGVEIKLKGDDGSEDTVTLPLATTTLAGLMAPAQVTKLAGIAEGANNTTVDASLSNSSTNPVQNKAVNTALGNKVDKVDGKGLSTNDFTTAEKNKLAGIAEGATKTVVDSSMSDSSTNPVQNKIIKKYVDDSISSGIAAADAMIFKGTIGTGGTVTSLPTTYKTGWTYRVITAGTYAGNTCEIGDLIIAIEDRQGSGNSNADWTVAQTNINGAITGITGEEPIEVTGSGSSKTIKHKASGVTSGTYGSSANQTPSFGGTANIPYVKVDAKGHVTESGTKTLKIPNSEATESSAGLMSSSDKKKINKLSNIAQTTYTLSAGSKSVNFSCADYPLNVTAYDSYGSEVIVDVMFDISDGTGIVSIASAQTTDITVVVTMFDFE